MVARHAFVSGLVQGVGFRYWTQSTARSWGLTGWVQNLGDGRVEVWIEGPREGVEAMVAALHQGPAGARVERVEVDEVGAEGLASFLVRRP